MTQHCCNTVHAADRLNVEESWWPHVPRCLIIGESPGKPGSLHFYDPIPIGRTDPVSIRRRLLSELVVEGLLQGQGATREEFRERGYFFDHAVRCQIPMKTVKRDRQLAQRYQSHLVTTQSHLARLIERFDLIWVMGRGNALSSSIALLIHYSWARISDTTNTSLLCPAYGRVAYWNWRKLEGVGSHHKNGVLL